MRRRARVAAAVAAAVIGMLVSGGVVGCVSAVRSTVGDAGVQSGSVLLDAEVQPFLETVPQRSVATVPMPRLAEGLVPPTNRWFSGMVFGDKPQPVFPLPLSFKLGSSGFSFGVPTIESRPGLITGPFTEHLTVGTAASSAIVTAYDEVSVTITLRNEVPLADVTIARGSPIISYRALSEHEFNISTPLTADTSDKGLWSTSVDGVEYALVAPDGEFGADGLTMTLPEGGFANWVAVPKGRAAGDIVALASSPLMGVDVEYAVAQDSATTTLRYRTVDGSATIIGRLPHQSDAMPVDGTAQVCDLGRFVTTYGAMGLCAAVGISFAAPASALTAGLDLAGLSNPEREEIIESLRIESGSLPDFPADTYFGGKAMARVATLLALARELQQPELVDNLEAVLLAELRTWSELDGCDSRADRCFVYDPVLRGMVGLVPSFGSEEFNDHHFHYGNIIYAAAIVAQDDALLVAELRPLISLLAADIASSGGENFPTRRAFDPYSGHSWASGFSPFADGNNQESSSEAVAAHHAVALWGAVAGDAGLEEEGRWMLALESRSALAYYTGFDSADPPYAGFGHGVVGIVWDGKRDYATWFSPEPAAILGIQLLPMRPGTEGSLAAGPERILMNNAEATLAGPAPQFADYLLMYQALAGGDEAVIALDAARTLPGSSIDDGNSRSYMLAWIMSHR